MIREISLAEVKKHNNENSDWIVIQNDVYDVTKYLSEHPGGEEVLLEVAGQEATRAFEDVGHSDDAREIMKNYKIGTLPLSEHLTSDFKARKKPALVQKQSSPRVERRVTSIVVPRERTRTRRTQRRVSLTPESEVDDSNWWKWALLILAGAITIGLIVKKKMG